ncbi:hypothetical protein NMG60_11036464 [Bertholletia excelsa]
MSKQKWIKNMSKSIDKERVTKECKLKVNDVFNLSPQMRVLVHFDEYLSSIGEVAELLAGVCGQMAINTIAFLICFSFWSLMPPVFLDNYFDHALKEKIQEHMSPSTLTSSKISPHDAVGVVLGPEHPGRIRGLGLRVVPSFAFRHTTTRMGGMSLGSTSATVPGD